MFRVVTRVTFTQRIVDFIVARRLTEIVTVRNNRVKILRIDDTSTFIKLELRISEKNLTGFMK